ncbi:GrpB family protein [Tissierella pigra]|uniref:GrpB family protein n=1 Tax=Tissierella pigra TaxID=2607614 RepID=A0A6N7XKE0_9FIRM|nr:GrpB family protein [Tissierella pigra]MBU5426269.1 GrpB family protein [Tissierella pigra]MSU01252.1 GrpB family protein [Tissierella pigra]
MKTKYVVVEDYNPEWKNEFERIKNELLTVLAEKINSIEHVGSTSIEGLAAKPIIDIDIVIDKNFEEVKKALESIGYIYEGDLGISGREAFDYKNKPHLMVHHLYVCNKDNKELYRHITFRNYLRQHKEDRDRYGSIKKEMALKYPEDIDLYIKGKESVILDIYNKCGLCK